MEKAKQKEKRAGKGAANENASVIREFTLMDDVFMRVCFDGSPECVEYVLRVIMEDTTLQVKKVVVGSQRTNLLGHSVVFDVFAVDANGKAYNIEIYKISRFIEGSGKPFNDGSTIMYMSLSCCIGGRLGELAKDFQCSDPAKIKSPVLRERVRYFKETKEGLKIMGSATEKLMAIGEKRGEKRGLAKGLAKLRESAKRMLALGKLTLEEIADVTGLALKEVQALAAANGGRKVAAL